IGVPVDLSLALPLFAAYLLDRVPPRPLKRLAPRRDELLDRLRQDRLQATLKRPFEHLP
ncbi:MAG: deoxyhypusine synthase, partial [Candidatus Eisenbacteria bacterium]|nr:deoxyhypusine synthase [Candidatus Eisenbacteria bacterium]